MRALVIVTIVAALASTASAERVTLPAAPAHAVSVQLATLARRGGSLEGEHDLGTAKLSIAGSLGARAAARGDFASTTVGVGVELRRWLRGPETMRGLYAGLRFDVARTSIAMDERALGVLTSASLAAIIGYRFVLGSVAITPSIGVAEVIEGDQRSTTARTALVVGLTAGWQF